MTVEEAIKYLERILEVMRTENLELRPESMKQQWNDMMGFYLIALEALRAQQERENPKPLTLDELREMNGNPVYFVQTTKYSISEWVLCVSNEKNWFKFTGNEQAILFRDAEHYGKTWLAYDHEPERSDNDA